MGKKHHKAVPPSSSGGGSMEMQAAEEMQAGRFRKARDLYKALCKEDRARYLPGLIESNRALARQLMEKGQIPEAQQVIAYLKTIAPQSALSVIDFEAAVGSRDWARACDCAFTLLGEPGTAIEGGLRLLIADVLVLGFPAREMVAARLADPFRTELGIILEALRGISETRYEAVQELIRPLPRGSMFAEWKVYIKGLLAFYGGDPVKAKTLFSQLSKGTTPEQAAHAFGPFWGERLPAPKESGRERAMVSLCAVLGEPLLGPALAQADQQWREGHFIGSYKKMRAVPGFPREETTLAGALSEFYMKACSAMSSAHYWDYVRSFDEFAATNSFKNPEEARLVYRMLMVEMARDPNDAPLEQYSRDFLALFPETDRYRNKIASLVLEHAGAYYAREKPHFRFAAPRKKGHRGIPLLEESIALDPANLGAYLKLLDLYEAGKKKSERNRLLDTMTLLFPREKGVLVRAGRECVERKAWGKGLDYFERAHELDRLDPGIVVELVEALLKMARQHYEKKNLIKGREAMKRVLAHAVANRSDLTRGLAFLKGRQAVLEMLYGDTASGNRLLEEAEADAGSALTLHFFVQCYYRISSYKKLRRAPFLEQLQKEARQITASERKTLYLVLNYMRKAGTLAALSAETEFVFKCLEPVAKKHFSMEEAQELIALLADDIFFTPLVNELIAKGLRRDRMHPAFWFFDWERRREGFPGEDAELYDIRDEAARRGDAETLKKVDRLLDQPGGSRLPDDEGWEDDEEDFPNPFNPAEMEKMKKKVQAMDDAEFEAFREKACQMVPKPLFDILFGSLRNPKAGTSKRTSRKGPDSPDLFDLFDL